MKRFALVFVLVLLLLPVSALADPTIIIEPEASGVPEAVVNQLVDDYPAAGVITILRHHTASETPHPPAVNAEHPALLTIAVLVAAVAGGYLCIRRKARTA